ncbi:MAG: glycosyltransferase WbuB [Aeromicrobium sp.]|nr:glycosyltransferase WbuB [Aeromicrobium sp.]
MAIRPPRKRTAVRRGVQRLLASGSDADISALAGIVGTDARLGDVLERELASAIDSSPAARTLLLADAVLTSVGADEAAQRLAARLAEHRPDLLLPRAVQLRPLLTVHKPAKLRAALDRALATTDPTGVDLDILVQAGFGIVSVWDFRRVAAYVAEHGAASAPGPRSRAARLGSLIRTLDERPPGWEDDLDAWTQETDDLVYACCVALSIKAVPALVLLAPRVDRAALSEQQISRVAEQLWRVGENELALDFARDVRSQGTVAAGRAGAIIDEHASFSMMRDGWAPPPRREAPAYATESSSVLHVLQNSLPYRRTGAANRTQGLLAGLVSAGYRITGVTPPGFPDDLPPGVELEPRHVISGVTYQHLPRDGRLFPRFPVQDFVARYARDIVEQARAESAALVHAASNSYNALAGIVAARELGVPAIYEVRGLYEEVRRSKNESYAETEQYRFAVHLETLACHEADRVIAITEGLKATLIGRGVPADKITVVPNGVDTQRFRPLERDDDLARHYGLEDAVVIGYIGSLNWYEGHDLLFEAFARVHARHPDARLLIVGEGTSEKGLRRLRTRLGLEDAILMPGSIPFHEVEAHYSIIDIAPITRVSSPVTETVSPLKPFEAMAMAKAVLSSDVAIMTEVIEDGHNGLLFRKDDVDSLERALERLVADPDLRAGLGRQAREWVVAERDWTILAARVADVYRSL